MLTRILAIIALLAAACSSDPDPSEPVVEACQLFADAVAHATDCDRDELAADVDQILDACGRVATTGPCVDEMEALYLCLSEQTYRCYPESSGPIAPGTCVAESLALAECSRPRPDKGAAL